MLIRKVLCILLIQMVYVIAAEIAVIYLEVRQKRNSSGFWPKANQIIELDSHNCIKCGACIKRCHFDVFTKVDGIIKTDISKCVGCGICSNSCPTKALKLQERK